MPLVTIKNHSRGGREDLKQAWGQDVHWGEGGNNSKRREGVTMKNCRLLKLSGGQKV